MRRTRRVSLIAQGLVLCLGLSASLPVLAQDDAQLAQARASFQQAVELEQAGNCPAALSLFRQVGQIRMTPQVRFHIAACEAQLGRLVAALGGFELALADADSVGRGFRDEVEENAQELRERIPKLTVKRGQGADTATIEIDGTPLGNNSLGVEVPLDPGPHAITASAPGYLDFSQTVTLEERGSQTVEVVLSPAPPEARGPLTPAEPPKSNAPAYVVGGVGIASLAGAGVLFALRQVTLSDLKDRCGDDQICPESARGDVNRLKVYHYGSIAAGAVGVAALGVATTLLLGAWDKPASKESSVSVQPVLAPNLAAADLTVRF